MDSYLAETFRPLLEQDPPQFTDRVNTPWDEVPDLPEYNDAAYRRIVRDLRQLRREGAEMRRGGAYSPASTRGVLVLGEAGTGKTHLLMRVARELSDKNHILFVRKPNNEEAVAQHVWANVVHSLSRNLPGSGHGRSQLDDLLAHVFSEVLVPEFERDIEKDVNAEQRQRWVRLLRENPYNLFLMLGEGEQRTENLNKIRRRTLRYLQVHHPDADQRIAHALITYCFVSNPERKRLLLTWLSGQDVDEAEAQMIGLPPAWVEVDERYTDVSAARAAEEQALRAIQTIGILSTYYQPLILAFDQLEGLRDEERLTQRWGDTVREIFTMTPNFLVVTCIFPSLWESWFGRTLERSAAERISQQVIELERFGPRHAAAMLRSRLEPSFKRHGLPTNLYPFTEDDVGHLCFEAASPRAFLQKARRLFDAWLDEAYDDAPAEAAPAGVVTQEAIDACLREALDRFAREERGAYGAEIPIEQEFFGRVRDLVQTVLDRSGEEVEYDRASYGGYVMPPNLVVRPRRGGPSLCVAVMNGYGNSFAARARNLNKALLGGVQFDRVLVVRDRRCKTFAPKSKSQEYLAELEARGGRVVYAGADEVTALNALYDALIAVEEHDLSVGSVEIDKEQFVRHLRAEGVCLRTELFRRAGALSEPVARAIGAAKAAPASPPAAAVPPAGGPVRPAAAPTPRSAVAPPAEPRAADAPAPSRPAAKPLVRESIAASVVIGDTTFDSPHLGLVGELRPDRRRLAVSLTKPQCLVLLGYMGSGKSYALGVLTENALLPSGPLVRQTRPMAVVAFNYRKNAESRFEYGGFARPNADPGQVETLRARYGAAPAAVSAVNVFGFEPELARRRADYEGCATYPIRFRPDELDAEHWAILMKPPSPQSEYMDVIRHVIQKLFYEERLTLKYLERGILTDERLTETQRGRAMNRLSFAREWIADERPYEWGDVLREGTLSVFDLRMQTLAPSEALKLCLVVTDLVRRTRNGVNKMVVFDEAHEYIDCKELVADLENAITQIRHDGLSFVLASQFPERIPERIFKYLLTRLIFKLPSGKAIACVRSAAPNLATLSPRQLSDLGLEQGVCFVQSDDDCTDPSLKIGQLLEIRPRCTQHGGATVRQTGTAAGGNGEPAVTPEPDADGHRTLGELNEEADVSWNKFLKGLGLPPDAGLTPQMTLAEARSIVAERI